ncbi:hypothetical protein METBISCDRAFT_26416 [Metschnikowia bicuspidata]|uniref:Cytochrome c oxidase-assembly factor COX23, mitochondrial n=1 Tax=Metschnikowia bicuspidata TaxID=27322 RepID=A0A4P9ZGQ4_9ASCO|nr:hypothetical protein METBISCDRAFT_26416 [Metschnikowia bicuspidata]
MSANTEKTDKTARSGEPALLGSAQKIKEAHKIDFAQGSVDEFKFYPDNPKNHKHRYKWTNKLPSQFYDPCEESRQASIDCVLRNQADKSVCQDFFDAYRECTKDFFAKRKKDMREGRRGWGF